MYNRGMKYQWPFLLLVVLLASPRLRADEFFESRVRPLLVERCYECHQRQAEGGLRLDSRAAILRGGQSGPALVVGNPGKSLMIQAVRREHDEVAMPPDESLTDDEVSILERWVQEGARWPAATPSVAPDPHGITAAERSFWSFQPITKTTPPELTGPWGKHPVDAFVASAHQAHRLTPADAAPPRTLLRRLSFNLTGLPPTPQELDAFEQDAQHDLPRAMSRQIDRLLDSQHYGERWGQHWLDLVRYADTAGDAADFPIPEAYKYRNYVIAALNDDKPYDQFVREQIAGDLIVADDEAEAWQQTVATGYIALSRRVGVVTQRHIVIEDTLNNLGKTFLGLTIGCARCHDHKFDPIPTADYYALYGIFDSSTYPHAGSEHQPYRSNFVFRDGRNTAEKAMAPYREQLDAIRRRERAAFERYRDLQRKPESELGYTREEAWSRVLAIREELRKFVEEMPTL